MALPWLLPMVLGTAFTAIGDDQQRRRLKRISDELIKKEAEIKGVITSGYDASREDLIKRFGFAGEKLTDATEEAEQALRDGYGKAMDRLIGGNAGAAEQILRGLGLATDEIEKWVEVAQEGMQSVVDYGKAGIPYAHAYLKEMNDAILNPDSIFESNVWKSHKTVVMDALTNASSARSGVTSSNTANAIADRISKDAMAVRNNHIQSLQAGFAAEQNRIGMGTNAQNYLSNLAASTGLNLANLTTNAYNQLGANEMALGNQLGNLQAQLGTGQANLASQLGTGLANLEQGLGTSLANLGIGRTSDLANLGLGMQKNLSDVALAGAQNNPWTNLGSSLFTIGGKQFGGNTTTAGTTAGTTTGTDPGEVVVDAETGEPVALNFNPRYLTTPQLVGNIPLGYQNVNYSSYVS